jgi:Lon-like ATP-dependent protease
MAYKVKDKSGTVKYTGNLQTMAKESVDKVITGMFHRYELNPREWYLHVDFSQTHGVDGPSAGMAMAVALASIFENKYIRQDIAITGEILLNQSGRIEVGPVGGITAKIRGAEMFDIPTIILPEENRLACVNATDFKAHIIGVTTLEDVLKIMLVEKEEMAQRCIL